MDNQQKKDIFLDITKKYFPENYVLLSGYDEAAINTLTEGDSLQDYFLYYPTIIHEAFHVYKHTINPFSDTFRVYRLDDTLNISMKYFTTFPSKKLNDFVKTELRTKIFRYETYIDSKDPDLVTQQDGFFGLLEEYTAYYQSLKAFTSSFYFLRDTFGWNRSLVWIKYLNEKGSEIYAINEFKLFFSWYLQYAKLKNPRIFKELISDKNIKLLFSKIETNSQIIINTFLENRDEIIRNIQPYTEIRNGFIQLTGVDHGYGIDEHIKNLRLTDSLLKEPGNNILEKLRQ